MPEEARGKTGKPGPERLKPSRPRDELGRPQAWDERNRLEMPDFDAMTLEENHAYGIRAFEGGRYFPAHEAWETAWKQARDTDDAEFFKGLSQLGAGYVHLLRGNAHGAKTLMRRGAGRVARYPHGHHGVDTERLAARAQSDANAVERGELEVGPDTPIKPPRVTL